MQRELGTLSREACSMLTRRALELSQVVRAAEPMTISAVLDGFDLPLVFVNDAFLWMTGYERSECLGKNCRFLQGKYTSVSAVALIRKAIEEENNAAVKLINYRKDGTPFVNGFRLGKDYENNVWRFKPSSQIQSVQKMEKWSFTLEPKQIFQSGSQKKTCLDFFLKYSFSKFRFRQSRRVE